VSADEVVVDASLALKWVEEEPYSSEAWALLQDWQHRRLRMLAPALFADEAANAIAKRVKRHQLTLAVAKERLSALLENGPALEHDTAVNIRALEVMNRFSLPSAYDAHYPALAESRECECWTADERLWNTVRKELPWVHWVGQHAATTME
jgi:predicted nucleic acid-binding protein